jgi:tRNA A37 threonylcarbamoyladenosine dehydratase
LGCGGIGGFVIEELARIGVGAIKAIDPDIFEENNLNRQVLSTLSTLGRLR